MIDIGGVAAFQLPVLADHVFGAVGHHKNGGHAQIVRGHQIAGEVFEHRCFRRIDAVQFEKFQIGLPRGLRLQFGSDDVEHILKVTADTEALQHRAVPGAIVRRSAFIAKNVVLMPSFVNLGAYVDEATMIDTWSTVGSCAQIGKRVHISGGVGIGGVLEPLQAGPVIIEDDCFIGARSEVAEGVIVRKGAVLAMGVFLGASTKIVDRETGETFIGEVPEYSVLVPGTLPGKPLKNGQPGPNTACAVIVKRVDERTRSKTSINELLRD